MCSDVLWGNQKLFKGSWLDSAWLASSKVPRKDLREICPFTQQHINTLGHCSTKLWADLTWYKNKAWSAQLKLQHLLKLKPQKRYITYNYALVKITT